MNPFPCNSAKCHCQNCQNVRKEIERIADDRIAVERVACNISGERFGHHALRTKHVPSEFDRSREHFVRMRALREGRPSKGLQHDAADAARILGYDNAERVSPEPLRNSRHIEERGKGTFYSTQSYYDRASNRVFKWRWQRGSAWRKMANSGEVFGTGYRKVLFVSDGYRAWRFGAKIGRPDEVYHNGVTRLPPGDERISAIEHTVTDRVGDLSHTVTDRVEFTKQPDIFGWQHQYRWVDGKVEWLGRWKDIQDERIVETEPPRKWHGMVNPIRDSSWMQERFNQAMKEVPPWTAWTACNPALNITLDEVSIDNLRAAFLGGGAKTGPDAENDPINLGGTMISALKLSILFWRKAHNHQWPYPCKPDREPGLVRQTLRQLEADKLIKFGAEDLEYTLTPRAEALIEAIQNLPYPVQPEPVWVMPKA